MFDFWETDLTEEETSGLLDKVESEIVKRKLVVPAIIFLEMHKPISYIAANAAVGLSPFLVPFFGFEFMNNYSRLLAKRDNVERLIKRLEGRPKNGPSLEEPVST